MKNTSLLLGLQTLLLASSSIAATARPNVVVILADDLGYADVGYRGSRDMLTPNIDSIARQGVQFTAGYVTAPVCGPSRAGFLSGMYQNRFGFEDNPGPNRLREEVKIGIPKTVKILPERLKALGYVTGMVGKWHTGDDAEFQPLNSGFDEFFGFNNGASNYRPDGRWGTNINQPSNPIYRGWDKVEEKEYLTDAFGREAVAFIDRHQNEPFFLYLPFNAIHGPQQATDEDLAKFKDVGDEKRRLALAMNYALDRNVGRVLEALRRNGVEDNTLVVFFSDNGGKPDNNGSLNTPLRGEKGQLWEGGIRVPFVLQWPAKVKGGQTLDFPITSLDLLPTIVTAAGGPAEKGSDGINLLPLLNGETAPANRTLQWRFNNAWAIRDNDWKLIKPRDGNAPQLFRIVDDVSETHDVSAEQPEVLKRLQAAYDAWNSTLSPKLWGWDKNLPIKGRGAKEE
jgi:arylsulfatase A-like enzyme